MERSKKRIFFSLLFVIICVFPLAGFGNDANEKEVKNVVTMESQTIGLTGVHNARQLGGYITIDGKTIKDGVLLRTGNLSNASKEDVAKLTEKYNLKIDIDLRTVAEIDGAPDVKIDGVTEKNIRITKELSPAYLKAVIGVISEDPVGDAIMRVEDGTISDTIYSNMVTNSHAQKAFKEFFDTILKNEDGAILFHCSQGKDRTGVAAVLILSALGVDEETIMKDFLLTNDFNAEKINFLVDETKKRTEDPKIIEGVHAQLGVEERYMQNMYATIDKEYGSMDSYLKELIGLSDKDIQTLKDRYLE